MSSPVQGHEVIMTKHGNKLAAANSINVCATIEPREHVCCEGRSPGVGVKSASRPTSNKGLSRSLTETGDEVQTNLYLADMRGSIGTVLTPRRRKRGIFPW
jgi:hypothetical protein